MFLKVSFNSNEAICIQLHNQIVMGIVVDMIWGGDTLPSIRQMADYIDINMHTANKAYSVLCQGGFVELDRRKGAVVSLDANKMQAIDDVRGNLSVVLAWGICEDISRGEIYYLVDKICDRYIRGCMGMEDGRETGEGQKLSEHGRRLSVRTFRHVLKKGQDRVVQKVRVRFWIITENSYVT